MEFSRQEHWSGLPFPPPTLKINCTSTKYICFLKQLYIWNDIAFKMAAGVQVRYGVHSWGRCLCVNLGFIPSGFTRSSEGWRKKPEDPYGKCEGSQNLGPERTCHVDSESQNQRYISTSYRNDQDAEKIFMCWNQAGMRPAGTRRTASPLPRWWWLSLAPRRHWGKRKEILSDALHWKAAELWNEQWRRYLILAEKNHWIKLRILGWENLSCLCRAGPQE